MKKKKVKFEGEEYTIHYPKELEPEIGTQTFEIFKKECYYAGRRKKNAVYLDLGASMGLASLYFRKWAKVIYALEPNPTIFEALKKNTEKYDNIKVFNMGVGPFTGEDFLYSHGNNDLPQTIKGGPNSVHSVRTKFIALDEFLEQEKIDKVDVAKVDIEESEYIIFPSASFKRASEKIPFMIGEAHFQEMGGFPDAIPAILKEWGYKTKRLEPKDPKYLNAFKAFTFSDLTSGISKEYKVGYNTMFVAEK